MSLPRVCFALTLAALTAGCPDGGSKPPSTTPETPPASNPATPGDGPGQTTPTEPGTTDAEWANLLAELAATPATDLPAAALPPDATPDSQLYEGESAPNLSDPAGGADLVTGGVFTLKLAAPAVGFTETWISYDTDALMLNPDGAGTSRALKLKSVDLGLGPGTLTPNRITTECAKPGSANFKKSPIEVRYFAFPSPTAITNLPSASPPNTTSTMVYEVFTSNLGQPRIRSGALYREIQTPPVGAPVWKDFWVLEHDYLFPGPGVETVIERVNTGGPTNLKAFLQAQQGLRNAETPANQAKWSYVPTSYSWVSLCTTP